MKIWSWVIFALLVCSAASEASLNPLLPNSKEAELANSVFKIRTHTTLKIGKLRYTLTSMDSQFNGDTNLTLLVTVDSMSGDGPLASFMLAPYGVNLHGSVTFKVVKDSIEVRSNISEDPRVTTFKYEESSGQLLVR